MVLVLVGLPARGKTYIARKIARYVTWLGYSARVFNVGNYRRRLVGAQQSAEFFDPDNAEAVASRTEAALAALADVLAWIEQGGQVAIYDATNSTVARRRLVQKQLTDAGCEVVFVESMCNDPAIVAANVRETKLSMPDYEGADPDDAVADFLARIAHYERSYEPLEYVEGPFIRLVDVGERVEVNGIRGYLPGRLVFFLMNLHITPRPIYLTRHGQSEYNVQHRIGGDAPLSPLGEQYALNLGEQMTDVDDLRVWTSTLRRSVQTGSALGRPLNQWRALDEIDAGVCDGMTYRQIADELPEEFEARQADKLRYRYPRGESYLDVIRRLDPVIIELERVRTPVIVVAHQAVIRVLYAYLCDEPRERCPHLAMPLHTLIRLTPKAYGALEDRTVLGPPVVNVASS